MTATTRLTHMDTSWFYKCTDLICKSISKKKKKNLSRPRKSGSSRIGWIIPDNHAPIRKVWDLPQLPQVDLQGKRLRAVAVLWDPCNSRFSWSSAPAGGKDGINTLTRSSSSSDYNCHETPGFLLECSTRTGSLVAVLSHS